MWGNFDDAMDGLEDEGRAISARIAELTRELEQLGVGLPTQEGTPREASSDLDDRYSAECFNVERARARQNQLEDLLARSKAALS